MFLAGKHRLSPVFDDAMESSEVLALERAIVSGGHSPAHSCEHCTNLNLPLIPGLIPLNTQREQQTSYVDGGRSGPFRYSRTHAQQCADSGCAWWLFIHKQIRRHELVCEAKRKWKALCMTKADSEQGHSDGENDDDIEELESVFLSYDEAESLKDYMDKCAYEELLQLVKTANLFKYITVCPPFELLTGDVDSIWLDYSRLDRSAVRSTLGHLVLQVSLTLVAYWDNDKAEGSRRSFAAFFQVLAQPGDLGGSVETAMPVNVNPGSSSSFALMRYWLHRCESHGCGFAELPSTMPSMLLDVQDLAREKCIKLIEVPASMKERYIALSYCWGALGQKVMNTKATRETLFTGMDMTGLDQSIQDAIEVTRELGFRYIWIDALCIPQDDPEAQGKEIACMAEIYGSSTFTIYASRAQTVQKGFLLKRMPAAWGQETEYGQQVVFQSRMRSDDQASREADAILIPQLGYYDDKQNEPLQDRAWTLQELILPSRRLSFGTRKTTWTCLRSDSGQLRDGWTESSATLERLDDAVHVNASTIVQSTTARAPETVLRNWYELVGLYSKRQISFRSDRLPAISALARVYSRKIEDDYLGGYWKSTLPIELIILHRFGGILPALKPTWSWISYDGQISWDEGEFVQDGHFEILDCHIDYTTATDIFGAIDGSKLRVRGLLYHAASETMQRDQGRPRLAVERNINDCSPSEFQSLSQILNLNHSQVRYDYDEEDLSQNDAYPKFYESLHLLLIAYEIEQPRHRVESSPPQRSPHGLVLYHHQDDIFSRVGQFVLCDHAHRTKGKRSQPVFPSTDHAYNKLVLELWHEQVQEVTIM